MKAFVFRLGGVLLGVFLASILLEAGLRASTPGWLAYRMSYLSHGGTLWPVDRRDGRVVGFLPGRRFRVAHFEYDHDIEIDDRGGRKVHPSCGPDEEPVPFLGDSYVFGLGVEDEETFVSILASGLERCLLNLGIPGAGTRDELNVIAQRHRELGSPKTYVLGFYSGNDFELEKADKPQPRRGGRLVRAPSSRRDRRVRKVASWIHDNALTRRMYSVQFVKARSAGTYNRLRGRRGGVPVLRPMERRRQGDVEAFFRTQVDSLAAFSIRFEFQPIVVIIPHRYEIFDDQRAAAMRYYDRSDKEIDPRQPSRIARDVLGERNIPAIDMLSCLRERGSMDDYHFVGDNHFNAEGHRLAAACMLPRLRELLDPTLSQGLPSTLSR